MIEIDISVRNLVEFVFRSGNIDSRFMSMKRAVEGTRIHVKFQKIRKKQARLEDFTYESEVSLEHSIYYKDFRFNIDGRADGIMYKENEISIEEIKSTYRDLDFISADDNPFHLAQAKFYAFIYADIYEIKTIGVLLTYYNIETNDYKTFEYIFEYDELKEFITEALAKYYEFAKLKAAIIEERNRTAAELEFPYSEYRPGQRKLAVAVYKTIGLGKKLFAQAPTGIGKTISTLFPSIKALSTKKADKIFYLTAKTITRQVAEDAFELMIEKNLRIRIITLTAKEKICMNNEMICTPEECEFAKGHFDRVNDALLDILQNELVMKREIIENYAKKHNICPFEFGFDIIDFCDCVICDYNYVYDPKVYLKNYFAEGMKNDFILLNDESHNLVDRAREMFSAEIDLNIYKSLLKSFSKGAMKKILNKIVEAIEEIMYSISGDNAVFKNLNNDFNFLLYTFSNDADFFMNENPNDPRNQEIQDLYFKTLDFLRAADFFDDCFVFYVYKEKSNFILKILCLDPSDLLAKSLERVKSSIFFSATLSPIFYFRKVLGANEEDFHIIIDSPFSRKNFELFIDSGISTKYINRENSYSNIAERLDIFTSAKKGNYIVFFPSYIYMEKVYDLYSQKYPNKNIVAQGRNLNEIEREDFLKNFYEGNNVLAFAVLGGIFSEGIDLIGERLIGACIVSVGLPLISVERNIISDYYNETEGSGFNFAYKYPGINKVLQAAGRVIRSENDRGVILLIDDRFVNYEYKILYPANWKDYIVISNSEKLQLELEKFWCNR